MSQLANLDLVRALQSQIAQREAPQAGRGDVYASGSRRLDRLLPGGGYCAGTLVEWLAAGSGAATLAMLAARAACEAGGRLVVVDRRRQFYPPAAAALGIDLSRVIVVQPENQRDELWAWNLALRSRCVAAVWGWVERLDGRWMRRWQLAAEEGQALGLPLRPPTVRGQPTWAEAQLLVRPLGFVRRPSKAVEFDGLGRPSYNESRYADPRWRVELVRSRGGFAGGACTVQLDTTTGQLREMDDDETNPLCVVSQLADPTPAGGKARA